MKKKAITVATKSGSISRLQARKAVLKVKTANANAGVARKSAAKSTVTVAPSVVERYLGHFGVGAGRVSPRKGVSAPKAVTSKMSERKTSRRAS